MRFKFCLIFVVPAFAIAISGCGADVSDCKSPNSLSGFVYVTQNALTELDGTLDDDVLVSDQDQPPAGFTPFKGAKVTVEETGASLELGEQGAFVFYPLPAGTYTLAIKFGDFPPVRRKKAVCVESVPSTYYYRPPYYYDLPVLTTHTPTTVGTTAPQTDTSGSWDEGGLSSWGEGEGASARKQ
ncbi:MAG: carboxypeptidase-like regulatory domain-containing protein [Candidatus Fervidibacter sp.]|uniref:carboxypeptidase-like regulatory domain-containing protein n=1 Tax=Candidatus Fervidibacter sp. TaxID=3100871 RepID=UPI00404AAB29